MLAGFHSVLIVIITRVERRDSSHAAALRSLAVSEKERAWRLAPWRRVELHLARDPAAAAAALHLWKAQRAAATTAPPCFHKVELLKLVHPRVQATQHIAMIADLLLVA